MIEPHVPPLLSTHLSPAGGRIGTEPEHFCVEEIPLYEAAGEGEHWYVFVEKRAATTQDLIQAVARAAGARPQDVGSAGLKDKQAVTRQWLSVPGGARPPEGWHLPDFARVLQVTRHRNKLRTGHLRANRFRITILDVPAGGLERARAIADAVATSGLPNYYGPQRFGKRGSSLAQALSWLCDRRQDTAAPSSSERTGARRDARSRGNKRHRQRFEGKFLSSVIQSEVFNRYLTARLALEAPLLSGEVVRLEGSSRLFVVEDVERELPRLQQRDIHRTGPLLGPRTVQAAGAAAELERRMLDELALSDGELSHLAEEAPGARRDLLIAPTELAVEEPEAGCLLVSFVLPAGSYATQLVRELTGAPWFELR